MIELDQLTQGNFMIMHWVAFPLRFNCAIVILYFTAILIVFGIKVGGTKGKTCNKTVLAQKIQTASRYKFETWCMYMYLQ